jgi:hypothetical protein
MDIGDTIAPDSQQLDAVDLLSGPRIFTITEVVKGNAEQPVQVRFAEFDRPWRPGKSMRRVLVSAWGSDASAYVGRQVELFCDPEVMFGGQKVAGTRISRLSHIDKRLQVPLLVSRGKSAVYVVQPLSPAAASAPPGGPQAKAAPDGGTSESVAAGVSLEEWQAKIAGSESIPELRGWWQIADAKNRKLIEKRVKAIEAEALDA